MWKNKELELEVEYMHAHHLGCIRITTLLCSVCTRVERLRMTTLPDKRTHHSSVELINNLSHLYSRALSAVYLCLRVR